MFTVEEIAKMTSAIENQKELNFKFQEHGIDWYENPENLKKACQLFIDFYQKHPVFCGEKSGSPAERKPEGTGAFKSQSDCIGCRRGLLVMRAIFGEKYRSLPFVESRGVRNYSVDKSLIGKIANGERVLHATTEKVIKSFKLS